MLTPNGANSYTPSKEEEPIEARRLELTLNPEDGSLMTAPLSTVLLAATDGLYADLYGMARNEIEISQSSVAMQHSSSQPADEQVDDERGDENGEQPSVAAAAAAAAPLNAAASAAIQKKERLSNLSFAQRRHELSWRLAQHGKSLSHVAALTAAASSSDLGQNTKVATHALQHARTAWVQADEAQDAMFFFHARLFPARQAPHDVLGALDVTARGIWNDLPTDLQLKTDQYDNSQEQSWSKAEVADRWHMAVRDKLLRGEVGWVQRQKLTKDDNNASSSLFALQGGVPLWRVSLNGGLVKITHGLPSRKHTIGETNNDSSSNTANASIYPLEAHATVLSTAPNAEWTLLNVEVRAQAKTGESNHQLDTSARQRYDLHRLCAQAMSKEEARVRIAKQSKESSKGSERNDDDNHVKNEKNSSVIMGYPLDCLFRVARVFQLSWQLEILSSQAQALKRGAWASSSPPLSSSSSGLVVTPVKFFDCDENDDVLGELSISFWTVDDRYGPPSMGDLTTVAVEDGSNCQQELELAQQARSKVNGETTKTMSKRTKVISSFSNNNNSSNSGTSNHLKLSIRAESRAGICVSLSGGTRIAQFLKDGSQCFPNDTHHVKNTVQELLDATSNPFALSASDALLAATRLCAEQKCHAIVQALQLSPPASTGTGSESEPQQQPHSSAVLPSWIHLTVERGSITVAAKVAYNQQQQKEMDALPFIVLFRLACDARTGSFVATFSRSATLLRLLACNDVSSSETMAMRMAKLAQNRRKTTNLQSQHGTGRAVREAFNSLTRSLNLLGQRTGVGKQWEDYNEMSASLRQRAIQLACADVRLSLMTCCGMAAVYGLSALALGVGTGVTAAVDMAGSSVEQINGISFLSAPPISITLDQQMVQKTSVTNTGDKKRQSRLERELFAVSCSVNEHGITLYGLDITVQLDSPSSLQDRLKCTVVPLKLTQTDGITTNEENDEASRPQKRARIESKIDTQKCGGELSWSHHMIQDEVEYLAQVFSEILETTRK